MSHRTAKPPPAPTFAEAQRRLAARRQERAAEGEARARALAAQHAQAAAARRQRLESVPASPLVQRLGGGVLTLWERLSSIGSASTASASTAASAPAFRVSQVDAELLDEELLDLLRTQVGDALQYIRNGTLRDDWDAEIMLVLRAALFKLSMWDHDATYGAALQNLRYADARGRGSRADESVPLPLSRWQKTAYGLATVGGRYAWTKWEDWLRDHDEPDYDDHEGAGRGAVSPALVQRLSRLTSMASDVYAGAAFVSFLVFLRYGRYRTLLDRVLRMRLVPPTSQVSREVSFEYLNRQLVWHAFTEFLLFLLPLVGINRWRRWLARSWRKTKGAVATVARLGRRGAASSDGDEPGATEEAEKRGEFAFLPERTCAICYQDQNANKTEADIMAEAAAASGVIGSAETDITNPYETVPCGCIYCYVCVATRIEREEGDGWTCLRCRAVVKSCRPWSGDVLEPVSAAAAAAAAGGTMGRPSSSSTVASGPAGGSPQKTVGFADDVKGDDDEDEADYDSESDGSDESDESEDQSKAEPYEDASGSESDDGGQGISLDESKENDSAVDVTGVSSSDTDSEGYEEEEEGMEDDE